MKKGSTLIFIGLTLFLNGCTTSAEKAGFSSNKADSCLEFKDFVRHLNQNVKTYRSDLHDPNIKETQDLSNIFFRSDKQKENDVIRKLHREKC